MSSTSVANNSVKILAAALREIQSPMKIGQEAAMAIPFSNEKLSRVLEAFDTCSSQEKQKLDETKKKEQKDKRVIGKLRQLYGF
jgi:hypothetical protein